jgi:hypothetical protein
MYRIGPAPTQITPPDTVALLTRPVPVLFAINVLMIWSLTGFLGYASLVAKDSDMLSFMSYMSAFLGAIMLAPCCKWLIDWWKETEDERHRAWK